MPVELHAPGPHDWQYYPPERYVSLESPAKFETSVGEAILWIDNHYFIHAANAHFGNATVSLAYGGGIEKFGYWYGITKVVDDYELRPGKGTPEMSVDGYTFQVHRSYDDRSDSLEFFVNIT